MYAPALAAHNARDGTTLVNSVSYGGLGGAEGLPSSLSLGNGVNGVYTATASYNALLQPTDAKLTRVSDGAVLARLRSGGQCQCGRHDPARRHRQTSVLLR
ncbi:MAG TPA: hypothetical protein VID73_09110 [Ktedonobacterales bacterium]